MAGVPRALVVEDDPLISQLLREVLDMDGYEVVAHVRDGALAAGAVREHRPDLVVLDVGLPNVSGLEVLDDIKGGADTAHIPVLVVTALPTPEVDARARALGAAGVLAKPFPLSHLSEAVAAATAGAPAPILNG